MGRRNRQQRRTPEQAAADRAADAMVGRLGVMLRDARRQRRWTLEQAAARAGISSSTWSRLELGSDGRATFATVNRAATAIGRPLRAYFEQASAADMPRDAAHLRAQELVMRTAVSGGWRAVPEAQMDGDARSSRWADVALQRANEYGLVEVFDWFPDVGAAGRDWRRRLDAVERHAIARMRDETLPRVGGIWVVRATQRNRQLVNDHRLFFRGLLPGSAVAWLAALTRGDRPMPADPALMWVSVKGDRLYPARLG